jgi:hypothetical protein
MILDGNASMNMAQQAADYSGLEQTVYSRADGSYIFCAKGNFEGLKMALRPNEQVGYVGSVKPSYWPKEEKKDA